MPDHKYRVGQIVDLSPGLQQGIAGSPRKYKILRLLPFQLGERHYRIKTITEPFARVVMEVDILPCKLA